LERVAQLIDAVGAGCFDPRDSGPVVVRCELWDGRVVIASYYRRQESEVADIDWYGGDVITDDTVIRPFVEKLLESGTSFVTEVGSSDMVCTLKWELFAGPPMAIRQAS